ncbi:MULTISPECIES: GNAT family N-acetyltransferase [unclassified Fusibacter]|uniref:GNAT family N-acetyltransferase n=1 Tax=unclassified Fusibacter TaxID=2624464 RepID=UPI001013AAB4|nr:MULTISPECIES: GNAT family protein [unclassified Fusibacter]MCK8058488.1 GNAT family N-acetyltransferase [Fusibacter sp. A2]NPE22743.1 GNAT family N-acetyltransferase [Fusibacter sp. A1]RXV60302.1 N-acetyltransferase [Fusibacter sp. A1]
MIHKPRLFLKPTTDSDLDFVLKNEQLAAEAGYVALWTKKQHEEALTRNETIHRIVTRLEDGASVGYLIANRDSNDNLELMRLVIAEKKKGYGRETIDLVKELAFNTLKVNRLWLDVRVHNQYATAMYLDMGFVIEGTLRNCVKLTDQYMSIHVMSILKSEYLA